MGEYRAPKSPATLRDYHWFCLEHVREYNRHWNYFDGLDEADIEVIRRQDAVWHRPSWPLGARPAAFTAAVNGFSDPVGALGEGEPAASSRPRTPRDKALEKLGLDCNASLAERKARYRELVKRHHPDTNGGCKLAEERLKGINEAYRYLLNCDEH